MGYYTELNLDIQLNENAPLDILEKLCNQTMFKEITGVDHPPIMSVGDTPNLPIDHPFGKTHRWDQIFWGDNAQFDKEKRTLKIKCDIKAYENDYEKLVDWLKPFIVSGEAESKEESMDDWIDLLNK